jgi:tetratricopeptide (TPR) repeat protein
MKWPLVALGCFLLVVGVAWAAQTNSPAPVASSAIAKPQDHSFVGSRTCKECHGHFYQLWATSHHGLAMQPYSIARTNLTSQTNSIKVGADTYRMDVAQGVVIGSGPSGEKRYPVEQAMGGKNVLYLLTPLERGRLQVLPVAYDLRRKQWYDTAGSAVRHFPMGGDEALDWKDPAYTFNTACFSCHVSQLTNNYTLKTDTYHTTWGEPGINCETCHGPSDEHVRLARETPDGQPLKKLGLINFKTFNSEQVNSACGTCHAKMYPLDNAFTPGDHYFDHFGLIGLDHPDFYPDGRELGEDFTYTSWRLSACLKSDQFNCVLCHTSSGRYRFQGAEANQACMPCHKDNVQNVEAHSHHKAGTRAPTCVSCHMPKTEFARMLRSDHSMRPPMPAATLAFGSPNACNLCHTKKDAAWADKQVRKWQHNDYQAATLERGNLILAARKHDWSKLPAMVKYLSDSKREEIWAASLIQLLRACDLDAKWPGILACLKDPSPFVRVATVEALGDQLRPEVIAPLAAATADGTRLVRIRAAGTLAGVPAEAIPEANRQSVRNAGEELLASFAARPDDPASYHNLGNLRMEQHELPLAIAAFETGLKLQPDNISSLVNVSLAYNAAGQNDKAEASLRRALQLAPTNTAVNLNLGMLLAELDKLGEAEQAFRASFKADPQSAQAAFNLGVLLAKEKPEEALTWCRRAADLRPQEPRYAYTLAFFQNQQGKTNDAAQTLEKLIRQTPAHAEAYGLLGQIYQQQGKLTDAASVYRAGAANDKLPEAQREEFRQQATALLK